MSKKSLYAIIGLVLSVFVIAQVTTLLAAPNYQEDEPIAPDDMFITFDICATCHNNLMDEAGNSFSFVTTWQHSTMAQSAIDPYWRASVRKETIANPPELSETIQDVCVTCHMPMARTPLNIRGELGVLLDENGFVNPDNPLNDLAIDGVSCLVCHQIQDLHLGEEEGFDGGYVIDSTTPRGERQVFGIFDVSATNAELMSVSTSFVPVQGEHIGGSELCATCHELITPFLDENGEIAGKFPEQTPYLEWENSSYNGEKTCQDCHMPEAVGGMAISTVSSELREGVGQHTFLGANLFLPRLLINSGDNAIDASRVSMQLTSDFLSTQAAKLTLDNVSLADGVLSADVVIESMNGHKLPTAYPSRRVWVYFAVLDSENNIVFESGGYDTSGLINGNDNDLDGDIYEPHYTEITDPDQVQIYETIMIDTLGVPTTTLLRASAYIKDNRIPPTGYDPATVPQEIAIWGLATEDTNFGDGMDTVSYRVDVGEAQGPFTVTTMLFHQPIAFRWAIDLLEFQQDDGSAPEIDTFLDLLDKTPNVPTMIVRTQATVE
jgi:hypothetical protein